MRTILAICLLTATFTFTPSANAAAACDPTYSACAFTGSANYGDCTNGYSYNYAYAFTALGYAYVGTSCGGYPGYYSYSGIYAGTSTPAGYNYLYWAGYDFFGYEGCYSESYTALVYMQTPLCDVAGAPPGIPGVLP